MLSKANCRTASGKLHALPAATVAGPEAIRDAKGAAKRNAGPNRGRPHRRRPANVQTANAVDKIGRGELA